MDELHDLFQERLARLEQGEPLEACLAGLPEEEASLLKMAAQLSTVNYPEQASDSALAQRTKLLQAARVAKEKNAMTTKPRWVLPAALSGVAAFAFICVIAVAAMAGFASLRRSPAAPRQVVIVTPSQNGGPTQIIPIANPQSGTMANVRGNVRVQGDDGSWATMRNGQTVTAGKRIRTGPLSSATLVFYDGSQARLGPNTELWIDSLNAQTSGPRIIQLTQWVGDTKHDVAHSADPASVYEVRTPSGVGTAKGTSFQVLVTALFVRFDVDKGAVAVANLNIIVVVVAGQSTTIPSGQPPGDPVFRVSGEGEVLQTGSVWNIGGQTFLTDGNTVIVGNPQVGDRVAVEGRLLPNGSRLADLITLLHRASKNTFSFSGVVESIGGDSWTISGREVRVDELTTIEDGIVVGDAVEVRGGIAQDGTFWAGEIRKRAEAEQPFEFTGVIDAIADSGWTISGVTIKVDGNTEIDEGLETGDVVKVEGHIQADGSWLAESITLADEDEHKFEITGPVESMDPWKVAGVEFETAAWTEIDENIKVGDRVKVEGRIQEDGTWVADEIKLIEASQALRFEFVGKVTSTDPWVIGGVTLATDENTEIANDIEVGDFVRVKGHILPDGALLADDISPLEDPADCFDTVVVVSNVTAEKIILLNGQTIKLKDIDLEGDVKVASIIIVHACVGKDGKIVIVSVIVIFQLDKLPDVIVIRPPDDPRDNNNNNNDNNGGNNDNNNCQDGDDHDHGKGNDCHKHGGDDGDDD
ncbi:MAG: FecR domain-containing protein [Chloroflexi bacterium]|nr:FecR domain-containing protein [Chloroflexota bacterium]